MYMVSWGLCSQRWQVSDTAELRGQRAEVTALPELRSLQEPTHSLPTTRVDGGD